MLNSLQIARHIDKILVYRQVITPTQVNLLRNTSVWIHYYKLLTEPLTRLTSTEKTHLNKLCQIEEEITPIAEQIIAMKYPNPPSFTRTKILQHHTPILHRYQANVNLSTLHYTSAIIEKPDDIPEGVIMDRYQRYIDRLHHTKILVDAIKRHRHNNNL